VKPYCKHCNSATGISLQKAPSAGIIQRDQLWITSKLRNSSHHPEQVRLALERSLVQLQLKHLYVYLMHWPVAQQPNSGLSESARRW
jgi:alcohol dehydrogenase (NADP+)